MLFVQIVKETYEKINDLRNVISYTFGDHCKCGLYGAQGLLTGTAAEMCADVMKEKKEFSKDSGRMALHIIVSFDKYMMEYVTPETALRIGYDISAVCFPGFQVIFGVHDNTDNLHIHFVINTVSYCTGKKISRSSYEIQGMKKDMEKAVYSYKPHEYVKTIDEL